MEIHALRSRSRLLPAAAVTLAVAAPLALASTASACWCPQGQHESAPGSEMCVADVPETQTVTPPAQEQTPAPTTETAAPAPAAETPAPVVEQAAAPAPAAPAPAPAAETPAAPAAPAAPAVQSGPTETPVAAEEQPQNAVLGEHESSKPTTKHTTKTKAVTAAAPATTAAAPEVQTVSAAGAQLPFTGLDTGLVAIMGAGLLGTGVVLRRRTQPTA
jgi:Tfp pilus assembly protein FimV